MLLVIHDVLAKKITNDFIYTFLRNKTIPDHRWYSNNNVHSDHPPPLLPIMINTPPPKSHDILKLSTPLTVFKSSTEQSTKLQSSDQKQDFQIKFEV